MVTRLLLLMVVVVLPVLLLLVVAAGVAVGSSGLSRCCSWFLTPRAGRVGRTTCTSYKGGSLSCWQSQVGGELKHQLPDIFSKSNTDAAESLAFCGQANSCVSMQATESHGYEKAGNRPFTQPGQRNTKLLLALNAAAAGSSSPGQSLALQVSPQSRQALTGAAGRAAVHFSLTQSYIHVESVQDGGGGGFG